MWGRGGGATLTSRHLGSATSTTLACPRCGSELIVPARSGDASEHVFQLRDGGAPESRTDTFDEWLCRSCALRWPHEAPAEGADGDAPPPGAVTPDDVPARVPEVSSSAGVTSPRVARELRAAREARGLSLSDAANATRIWERYLQALEANAPLEEFPAPAYARFFLRGYAEFLGIQPDAIVHEYDEDHPAPEGPILRPVPDARPRRRGIAGALVFVSIMALFALAVVRFQQGRQDEPRAPTAAAAPTNAASRSPATDTQEPPPPPVDHVRAVLRMNDRSWVEVGGDGQTLESGVVLEAGAHAVYRADRRLEITLGNAGGVGLEVNGDRVTTGSPGSVVTLLITLRDGEIHIRQV
jgi:transcriptional regulator with XRE-family HTH domain